MELENVQDLLQEAGIEVDLQTLQNPTEEFMTHLVIEYLKKFSIDGNEIAKPTMEQLECISCDDFTLNAIKVINLHAALATICEGIFLKDLSLTDITCPGFKKTCKRIKVLFNFFVYARNKAMEYESLFVKLDDEQRAIENMIEQKNECIAKTGSLMHEREMKAESIDKLKQDILKIKSEIQENEKIRNNLQAQVDEITAKHQEKLNSVNVLKNKALQLHNETKYLQSKIVISPEEVISRTNELKKIMEEKKEERQTLNDCINRKKQQISNNESAAAEVNEFQNKMNRIGEIMQKLKEKKSSINTTKKLVDELKEEIRYLECNSSNPKSTSDKVDEVDLEKSQKMLSILQNSLTEMQRESESTKQILEERKSELINVKGNLQKESEIILQAERDYLKYLNDLNTHFENEKVEEINFRKAITQLPK